LNRHLSPIIGSAGGHGGIVGNGGGRGGGAAGGGELGRGGGFGQRETIHMSTRQAQGSGVGPATIVYDLS